MSSKARACAEFAREFFESNPGASVNQCLKALANSRQRLAIIPEVVKREHVAYQQRKLGSMFGSPARPETAVGPRVIVPAPTEPESKAMRPTEKVDETAALKRVAAELLRVMREHGISQCLMTVADDGAKPRAEWEVEYRGRAKGAVDL